MYVPRAMYSLRMSFCTVPDRAAREIPRSGGRPHLRKNKTRGQRNAVKENRIGSKRLDALLKLRPAEYLFRQRVQSRDSDSGPFSAPELSKAQRLEPECVDLGQDAPPRSHRATVDPGIHPGRVLAVRLQESLAVHSKKAMPAAPDCGHVAWCRHRRCGSRRQTAGRGGRRR